jgi:hypothetical protein
MSSYRIRPTNSFYYLHLRAIGSVALIAAGSICAAIFIDPDISLLTEEINGTAMRVGTVPTIETSSVGYITLRVFA